MSDGVIIALIGVFGTLIGSLIVGWVSFRLKKQDERAAKAESVCEKRLAAAEERITELEEDNKKYAQYYIQSKKGL